MRQLLVHRAWLRVAALGFAVVIMLLVAARWEEDLAQWDERLASKTWALSDSAANERRLVIVDIDEKSVQSLGPWPWPRERVAALFSALDGYGVQLKVVDILFDGAQSQDVALGASLRKAPSVVGQLFSLNALPEVHTGSVAAPLAFSCPAQTILAHGHMAPPDLIATAATGVGHITPVVDPDGAVRRVPGILCYDGKAYPALAVAALAVGTQSSVRWVEQQGLGNSGYTIEAGGVQVPVDAQGHIRVSYAMPRSGFVSVSAADVLQGRVPADLLDGAWVLVGSTAMGAGDSVPTPQSGVAGGVEVHAQLMSAALDDRTPFVPQWAPIWPWVTGISSMALLLIALRLGGQRAGWVLPLSMVAVVGGLFVVHAALLFLAHQWLPWGRPAIFAVLAGTLLTGAELMRLRFERERLFQNFSSYLPEAAAQRLALTEPTAQVVAESRSATVMFIDLRNFSAFCDLHTGNGRSPQVAADVLHRFYTTVEKIVTANGGEVEQMVGDRIMAVWNGSHSCTTHAASALAAARPIWRAALAELPLQASRGAPPLDIGIGLESGEVLIGSFGPAQRRVHTVMGEPVNVAFRLQALTAELGYPVLVGPHAAGLSRPATDPVILKKLGDFLLEGLQQPRSVHALPVELGVSHLYLASRIDESDQIVHGSPSVQGGPRSAAAA